MLPTFIDWLADDAKTVDWARTAFGILFVRSVQPSDPDVIFAGYEPCTIYRTQDGGETLAAAAVRRLNEHGAHQVPGRDDLHAAENIAEGGLYRLALGGEWEPAEKGLPPEPQVRALLVHPDRPSSRTQRGVYRSDDRGDPGRRWRGRATARTSDVYAAVHHLPRWAGCSPAGTAAIAGTRWADCSPRTAWDYVRNNTVDLHGVQVSAAAPGMVYIITQVAMFRSRDRGGHWEHVRFGEMFPGGSYCRGLIVAPDDPRTMYLAAGAGGGGAPQGTQEAGALFRSRDVGETWERIDIGGTPPSRMFQIAIDRAAPSNVFCCAGYGQFYASADGGETWTGSEIPVEMSRSRHVYPMVSG